MRPSRPAPLRSLLLLFLATGLTSSALGQQGRSRAQMTDIVWDSRSSHTRFVIEFSEQMGDPSAQIEYRQYNLLPDRQVVYFDFYNLRPAFRNQRVPIPDGLLNSFEIQNFDDTAVVRLIFVIQSPEIFSRVSVSEEGYQLVIDLVRRDSGLANAPRSLLRPPEIDSGREQPSPQTPFGQQVRAQTTAPRAPVLTGRRRVVIIDPGHGGADLGAQSVRTIGGRRLNEKDVVLQIARRLEQRLSATGLFETHLTRTDDKHLSLDERVDIAHQLHGDVFVSIHANHAGNPSRFQVARGLELYYLSNRGVDRHAEETVENLNLDRRHERELRPVLMDTGFRMRLESMNLCRAIGQAFLRERYWYPENRGGHFRFIKGQNFHVLRNFDMPCVLVETGYMTNNEEVRRLVSPEFQEHIAQHITDGIIEYFRQRAEDSAPQVAGG
jgi:N-acetylmuramoyl-L-alanine amidase